MSKIALVRLLSCIYTSVCHMPYGKITMCACQAGALPVAGHLSADGQHVWLEAAGGEMQPGMGLSLWEVASGRCKIRGEGWLAGWLGWVGG